MNQAIIGDVISVFSSDAVINGIMKKHLREKYPDAPRPLRTIITLPDAMIIRKWFGNYLVLARVPDKRKELLAEQIGVYKETPVDMRLNKEAQARIKGLKNEEHAEEKIKGFISLTDEENIKKIEERFWKEEPEISWDKIQLSKRYLRWLKKQDSKIELTIKTEAKE